jgi:hypothetical protein
MNDDAVVTRRRMTTKKSGVLKVTYQAQLRRVAAALAEQGDLGPLESLLSCGERALGINLTPAECRIVREFLQGKRKRRRGPRADPIKTGDKETRLAAYCFLLELEGDLPKNAVSATMHIFGASKSSVYAARNRLSPEWRRIIEQMTPAARHSTREGLKANTCFFRSVKLIIDADQSK